ncbi:unnamed protein product [Cuscuta campestris]|uniref:Uncharacterized protein n=1 Tax=Cuscuta campestris TaxID=132261 RepID=A0A484MEI0_9ASTE|nr:unnamed protein product [Cuscuta campestris]
MQGLKQSRRLARGEIELRVGNGAPVAALAIGTYSLVLPSGLMLELNDCLYVPAISRNIISVSCLDKSGFIISIKDKSLSVYRKNVFYANANMTNGLYVLDLDMPVYNISAKRNKPNGLNQTYLWHCRLGHINEKRISKLHRSGMLESFDLESYDTCESCLLAKEGVWLKNFITELGVVPSIKNPIPLFCDNNGAIAQAKEPRSHQKTKHIVRRYHIIREIVARGDVEICKIDSGASSCGYVGGFIRLALRSSPQNHPRPFLRSPFSLLRGEKVGDFITRWEKEARDVHGADDQALVAMFQAALPCGEVRKELRRNPPPTYQETLARAMFLASEEFDDAPDSEAASAKRSPADSGEAAKKRKKKKVLKHGLVTFSY